jgi:hypothetical protein
MVGPPKKGRYICPTILWFFGFFVVMGFVGRAKLSTPMAIVSVADLLALPAFLIGTLACNLFVYPKKYRTWTAPTCASVVARWPRFAPELVSR